MTIFSLIFFYKKYDIFHVSVWQNTIINQAGPVANIQYVPWVHVSGGLYVFFMKAIAAILIDISSDFEQAAMTYTQKHLERQYLGLLLS